MQDETFCTDEVMRKCFSHLLSDLRTLLDWPEYHKGLENKTTPELREVVFPSRMRTSPILFKSEYQVETFFKRYIFEDDALTDKDRARLTLEKFNETQLRIDKELNISPGLLRILQRTRSIIKEILGGVEFSGTECKSNYGRKAAFGVPARESYLDSKVVAQTGSSEQFLLYDKWSETDIHLRKALGSAEKPKPTVALKMSLVPKSWKSMRLIRPGTTTGTYLTSRIGGYIALALRLHGLDIRRLQKKHRRLAQEGSITGDIATIDLSSASDSLTRELLHWVLPRWLFTLVKKCVIRHVEMDGTRYINSVCLMGDGHTFPLQTLVFYSLVKAIGDLRGIKGTYSVYGDDIICPSKLFPYVAAVFPRLHLKFNGDKTYVKDPFRESCGGDYYRGYDVRPFQPEGQHRHLRKRDFLSFLYKLWNGYRLRWESDELPGVFNFLESTISEIGGIIYQVPPSFPETAGCRLETPTKDIRFMPVIRISYGKRRVTTVHRRLHVYHRPAFKVEDGINTSLNFVHLNGVDGLRDVVSQYPYYWNWLRIKSAAALDESLTDREIPASKLLNMTLWDDLLELPEYLQDSVELLQWRRANPRNGEKQYSFGRKGQRLRRLIACVAKKNSTRYNETTSSISEWI